MNWKWFVILLIAFVLVIANLFAMMTFHSLHQHEERAQQRLSDVQLQFEQHQIQKSEYANLRTQYRKLLQDIKQLVFLSEKHGIELPAKDVVPPNHVAVFESDFHENKQIRILLPAGVKLKVHAHRMNAVPAGNSKFSQFDDRDTFEFVLSGAGWHSIDRRLVGNDETLRVVMMVDGKQMEALQIGSKQKKGSVSNGGNMTRLLPTHTGSGNWTGVTFRSGWCVVVGENDSTELMYGFVIDCYEVIDEQ